jgi:hypothetical protein
MFGYGYGGVHELCEVFSICYVYVRILKDVLKSLKGMFWELYMICYNMLQNALKFHQDRLKKFPHLKVKRLKKKISISC